MRFGDPRVQALAGALAVTAHLIGGLTHKSFRPLVEALLAQPYSQARCSYDLRRLKLKGLIVRLERSNTYVLTDDGQRFAVFYTKVHNRLLRPLRPLTNHPHRSRSDRPSGSSTKRSPSRQGGGMSLPAVYFEGAGRLRAVEFVNGELWLLTSNTTGSNLRDDDDRLLAIRAP